MFVQLLMTAITTFFLLRHKALQGGVAWDKGSAVSRFPEMAGRRVDADGEVMNEEGQLDLEDVDPGSCLACGLH